MARNRMGTTTTTVLTQHIVITATHVIVNRIERSQERHCRSTGLVERQENRVYEMSNNVTSILLMVCY